LLIFENMHVHEGQGSLELAIFKYLKKPGTFF
jgi:hypothetical protein